MGSLILFQMRLENSKAGRKGNLNVATEVLSQKLCWIEKFGFYFTSLTISSM